MQETVRLRGIENNDRQLFPSSHFTRGSDGQPAPTDNPVRGEYLAATSRRQASAGRTGQVVARRMSTQPGQHDVARCTNNESIYILNHFEALGLSPVITKPLSALGYDTPTPIQREGIPLLLSGQDLMGLAQTGTGKTAAFGLPLVQHLLGIGTKPASRTVRALILAPTRELVNQIAVNMRTFVRPTHLRVTTVVGGSSIGVQIRNLSRGTDILVATPGRLLDLVDRRAVQLETVKFLVLDEADQMLDLGFIHALRKIANLVGTPRQTMLFSATMPKQIADLSRAYLTDPVRIEMTPPGRAADKVRQTVHFVSQRAKSDLLKSCLGERPDDLSLVFSRTKHGAEKLMKHLVASGFSAGSIHGNKSQGQRERAIKAFRSGEIRILVATDVAARGIDIPGVSHVYNYDLPEVAENYIHRIGRTARAGAGGEAIAFCSPDQGKLLRGIEKLMGLGIEVAGGDPSATEDNSPVSEKKPHHRGQGPGGKGRNRQSDRNPRKSSHRKQASGGEIETGNEPQRVFDGDRISEKRDRPANANRPQKGRTGRSTSAKWRARRRRPAA